jgi:hypothetical protein
MYCCQYRNTREVPIKRGLCGGWWRYVVLPKNNSQAAYEGSIPFARSNELIHNEDWGDPRDYNITITRKGEKLDTEYTVVPSPKTEVPAELKRMYGEKNIDLEALYDGGNPFDVTKRSASLDGRSFSTILRKLVQLSKRTFLTRLTTRQIRRSVSSCRLSHSNIALRQTAPLR